MSVFKKLSSLNQDIELLEAFGDIKSASVLHQKFLKEAQSLNPTRDSGPYKQVFDRYLLSATTKPSQNLINSIRADGFLLREDQDKLIAYASEKMKNLAPTNAPQAVAVATPQTTSVTTPVATPVAQGVVAQPPQNPYSPAKVDYAGASDAYNMAQPATQNVNYSNPQLDAQNQANRAKSVGDTANQMQAQNKMPNPLYQENLERQLYTGSLNEIIKLFQTKIPEAINQAEKIYLDTFTSFKNDVRKKYFAEQVQRLRTQYNTARLKGQR